MNNTNNDVTIGGKWKILDKQYQGDLTFNKTNGIIILSIYYKDNEEFLAWMDKPTEITTITGKLNQEIKCTLVDCKIVKRHSDGFVRHHIVIVAKNMFINISKSEKSDIKFNEVHFQIPNIIKWSQLSGFEYIDDSLYTFKIGYKFKDTISEKIDDNTTIEFTPVFGKFNFDLQIESLDISQHVEVRIKKKKEKSYEEFFRDFDMIMNLITLATGLKINVSLVQGINYKKYSAKVGKKCNYIKYEIIKNTMNNLSTSNPDKQGSIRNFLFNLQEFASTDKLKKWFNTYQDYNNIYNLYNLGINNDIPDEIKFCNLMQALELMHTKKYKKPDKFFIHIEEKFKDNKEIIDLIENNPDQVNNKFIILKNRIIDIFINDFKFTTKENLINKIDELSTRFSDTRNYYTHYDDAKKDKCLVGKNLKYGIYILDYLVSNYILQNLGFNIEEINSKKDLVLNDIHNEEMIDKIIKNERIR